MANEQELSPRIVEVSRKYVFTLATAIITSAGIVGVAYYNNRPDDSDRFYGWQGDANTAAIKQIKELDKELKFIVDDYSRTKPMMMQRVATVEAYQAAREIEFNSHVAWTNDVIRQFSIVDTEHRMQLQECLRRLP